MEASFFFMLLCLGVGWMLFQVALRPTLIFHYPYFIAAVFAVFILPQGVAFLRIPGRGISDEAVMDAMIMSCLCFGAAVLGYRFTPSLTIFRKVARPVHDHRMLHIGLLFIICGLLFTGLYFKLVAEGRAVSEGGGLTGLATIYLFFGGLAYPGFAICLILQLKKPTLGRLMSVLLGAIIPLVATILGRREPAAFFGLVFVLGRYFTRRVEPSRLTIFGALIFAMLAIPATGTYRAYISGDEYSELRQIDLIDNFKTFLNEESILELRNAAAIIESTKRFDDYDFGAGYWNQIIFRFVPGQFVGREFKESLMIGKTSEEMQQVREEVGDYEFSRGSTVTGMGDSFKHFGWAGCLFFAIVAVVFRSIWLAAHRQDAFFAQLFYIMICTSGMRAVTHQTMDFLPGMIYQGVFLGLGLLYAGKRGTNLSTYGSRVPHATQGSRQPTRPTGPPPGRTRP